mmetsp:Transcript_14133/g.21199  ORF Transcript_14133/g.21199 Transcript_14133/m.21199 type:complete len:290 (-) Transcript_14133:1-870(-)
MTKIILKLLAFMPLATAFQSVTTKHPAPALLSSSLHVSASSFSKTTLFQTKEGRRNFLESVFTSAIASVTVASAAPAIAVDITSAPVEMKTFVDPKGLFALNIPKGFFAIRRTAKGDLPDEKTGKGRRGSSIFTAGDMGKAEVIAVERFPTFALLADEGITPVGDLSSFPSIGDPTAVANLIALRRDKDKKGQARTFLVPNSVSVSEDGLTLRFEMATEIDVQKPELLLEQTGVSELKRITLAKATLTSADGQMLAVFASALQQDFDGVDGVALKDAVDSFVATDQSKN